ncbi:MAG: hypothetical protein K2W84_16410 [Burkholderiales bacterium]|nr:hypothetical protein [Burkholderiales bacterium]
MIFALMLGAILGFTALSLPLAFVVLAVSLALKVIADIRFEKLPFFNAPSPFLIYCHNLAERGEPTGHAWFSYAVQLIGFGMIFGGALLVFGRYLQGW